MLCIGIDPGYSGAICAMSLNYQRVNKLPLIIGEKVELDIPNLITWITEECRSAVARAFEQTTQVGTILYPSDDELRKQTIGLVVIEKVSAMPKQGVVSMFRFGTCYGELRGMIKALHLPLAYVTPQAWKKCVLAGTKRDKDASIGYVRSRYPKISLLPTPRCTTQDDGMADAVCIAEYGQRELMKT